MTCSISPALCRSSLYRPAEYAWWRSTASRHGVDIQFDSNTIMFHEMMSKVVTVPVLKTVQDTQASTWLNDSYQSLLTMHAVSMTLQMLIR